MKRSTWKVIPQGNISIQCLWRIPYIVFKGYLVEDFSATDTASWCGLNKLSETKKFSKKVSERWGRFRRRPCMEMHSHADNNHPLQNVGRVWFIYIVIHCGARESNQLWWTLPMHRTEECFTCVCHTVTWTNGMHRSLFWKNSVLCIRDHLRNFCRVRTSKMSRQRREGAPRTEIVW